MQLRIEDLNVAAALDVGRRDFTLSRHVNTDGMRIAALHFEAELLDVEHNARHIVAYARKCGELV